MRKFILWSVLGALGVGVGIVVWSSRGDGQRVRQDVKTKVGARAAETSGKILFFVGAESDRVPVKAVKGRIPRKADAFIRAVSLTLPAHAEWRQLRRGDRVSVPYFDGRTLAGTVNLVLNEGNVVRLAGSLDEGGSFSIGFSDTQMGGRIMPTAGTTVGVIEMGRDDRVFLLEKDRAAVLCLGLPAVRNVTATPVATATAPGGAAGPAEATAILNSRPEAAATIYLDFDGEVVTDPAWNGGITINAAASGLTATQIESVWRRVAEDYRPFQINVTTELTRYTAAIPGQRMRCIITTTTTAAPTAGGVAYPNSWEEASTPSFTTTVPAWVFSSNLGSDTKNVAEAISHEIGHTLGLSHDGLKNVGGATVDEYYEGHGAGVTGWAPIMGVGYYQPLAQWSRGEYVSGANLANNTEDDLAIIADTVNLTRYTRDDVAATLTEANVLRLTTTTTADTTGEIGRTGEVDTYAFAAGAGAATLQLVPPASELSDGSTTNLDAKLEIFNASGALLLTANPTSSKQPVATITLASGTYFVKVTGVGEGSVTGTGYSDYGSMGRYRLTGTWTAPTGIAPVVLGAATANARVATAFSLQIEATGLPTLYAATGLPAGLTLDTSTGIISGQATTIGVYAVSLTAQNAAGISAPRVISLRVIGGTAGDVASGDSVLTWTSGGDRPWRIDEKTFFDGFAAARSGDIGSNNKTSFIQAALTGPGVLRYRWKVSSEATFDLLKVRLDNAVVSTISGEVDWALVSITIPTGAHTVKWTYSKDAYTIKGEDAAWIDNVVFVRAPSVTAAQTTTGVVGTALSYTVAATGGELTYTASNLPPGLAINAATGVISGMPTTAGTTLVNLGVSNTQGAASGTLTITVVTAFDAWAATNSLMGLQAATTADPDGDGLTNALEYALALDPRVATTQGAPTVQNVTAGDGPHLEITFVKPVGLSSVTYLVEVSTDLITWQPGHRYGPSTSNSGVISTLETSRTTLGDGSERIVVRDNLPGSEPRRFIRLRVTL
jgi:hypothetical protein